MKLSVKQNYFGICANWPPAPLPARWASRPEGRAYAPEGRAYSSERGYGLRPGGNVGMSKIRLWRAGIYQKFMLKEVSL